MSKFVRTVIGAKYTESQAFDLERSFQDSGPGTPIFVFLSPGVDVAGAVEAYGRKLGYTSDTGKYASVSLGQGQENIAMNSLRNAQKNGGWVLLQNIHLTIDWTAGPLEKVVDKLSEGAHEEFRLFLSAEPPPALERGLPISILQASIKLTNEPPEGLRANLLRAFNQFTEEMLEGCSKNTEFRCIIFALCYFHAALLERKKFGVGNMPGATSGLGWNMNYPFNTGDLLCCGQVAANYLEINNRVPWEDLRYVFVSGSNPCRARACLPPPAGQPLRPPETGRDHVRRPHCRGLGPPPRERLPDAVLQRGAPGEHRALPRLLHPARQHEPQAGGRVHRGHARRDPAGVWPAPQRADRVQDARGRELLRLGPQPPAPRGALLAWRPALDPSSPPPTSSSPPPCQASGDSGMSVEERAKMVLDDLMERMTEQFDMEEIRSRVDEFSPYIMVAIQMSRSSPAFGCFATALLLTWPSSSSPARVGAHEPPAVRDEAVARRAGPGSQGRPDHVRANGAADVLARQQRRPRLVDQAGLPLAAPPVELDAQPAPARRPAAGVDRVPQHPQLGLALRCVPLPLPPRRSAAALTHLLRSQACSTRSRSSRPSCRPRRAGERLVLGSSSSPSWDPGG